MPEVKEKTLEEFNKEMYTDLFGGQKTISDPLDGRVPDFIFSSIFDEPTKTVKPKHVKNAK